MRTEDLVVMFAQVVARLVVIPLFFMTGGITIAQSLGFTVYPSLALFMAAASVTGFPWAVGMVADLITQWAISRIQREQYEQMMTEYTKVMKSAALSDKPADGANEQA